MVKESMRRLTEHGRRRRFVRQAAVACVLGALGAPLVAPTPVSGQVIEVEGIAAVINDDVITTSAVLDRIALALFASGLEDTDENRRRVLPQVVRALIDEELQRQEADRLGLAVQDEAIQEAVGRVAQSNGMSYERFLQLMAANGVPISTLENQIGSTLLWREVIRRRIVPQIDVSEEEVNEILSRIEGTRGLPEYLLSDLFLLVDDPAADAEIRGLAAELAQEVRDGGSFGALASQFSDGAGALNGGSLGWVIGQQLDPALREAVESLTPGQVSDPIRTASGYHVLLLRDQREANVPDPLDTEVALGRIALPFPANMTQAQFDQLAATALEISQAVNGCEDLRSRADAIGAPDVDAGTGPLRRLPPDLAALLNELEVGEPSEPIRMPDGLAVFMICERFEAQGASFEQIMVSLQEERADLAQQRYLRDLRNAAFIDVRLF